MKVPIWLSAKYAQGLLRLLELLALLKVSRLRLLVKDDSTIIGNSLSAYTLGFA